jgi:hypothetical protein
MIARKACPPRRRPRQPFETSGPSDVVSSSRRDTLARADAGRALRPTGPARRRHITGGLEMARDWEQARAHLVSQRQSLIEQLAKGFVIGESEHHVELLLKIQAAIDVLDTADESDEDEEEDEDEE